MKRGPTTDGNKTADSRFAFALAVVLVSVNSVFSAAQQSVRGAAESWALLRVTVVDHDSGLPVSGRCYLTDPAGQSWSPPGAINYVKPPERHFITSGEFQIALPPRKYTLAVERGPEYRPVSREIEVRSGEAREEKVELARWVNMNSRGWFSGDLHNHRDWNEMPELLLAEDLNLAPTLTQWVWEDHLLSSAPPLGTGGGAVRRVDATHVYSVEDTEIERLRDGTGAVDLVGLSSPILFRGTLLSPPDSVFAESAHRQGGYVDAEKITWRNAAALLALGDLDFAGLVYNHFNRHGVDTETDEWGMVPKEKAEYQTPAGMPLWAMDLYYKFLNCGFKLPVSAGSASGVKPSPLGYDRTYVHLAGEFGYREWFRSLKAGRSFATNGPMLFLSVNGHQPGDTIVMQHGKALAAPSGVKVRAEARSSGELDRLEIVWKGRVVKSVQPTGQAADLTAELDFDPGETGWIAARAFEKPREAAHFAHTSPVYVQVGQDRGLVANDAKFFVGWMDREIKFYENLAGFSSDSDRQATLALFKKARAVYVRLAAVASARK